MSDQYLTFRKEGASSKFSNIVFARFPLLSINTSKPITINSVTTTSDDLINSALHLKLTDFDADVRIDHIRMYG